MAAPTNLPNQRQRFLKDYLTALSREYCHENGLGYLSWERSVAAGQADATGYCAIASDGQKAVRLPFTAKMKERMKALEEWVRTGVGDPPPMPGQEQDDAPPLPTPRKGPAKGVVSR